MRNTLSGHHLTAICTVPWHANHPTSPPPPRLRAMTPLLSAPLPLSSPMHVISRAAHPAEPPPQSTSTLAPQANQRARHWRAPDVFSLIRHASLSSHSLSRRQSSRSSSSSPPSPGSWFCRKRFRTSACNSAARSLRMFFSAFSRISGWIRQSSRAVSVPEFRKRNHRREKEGRKKHSQKGLHHARVREQTQQRRSCKTDVSPASPSSLADYSPHLFAG